MLKKQKVKKQMKGSGNNGYDYKDLNKVQMEEDGEEYVFDKDGSADSPYIQDETTKDSIPRYKLFILHGHIYDIESLYIFIIRNIKYTYTTNFDGVDYDNQIFMKVYDKFNDTKDRSNDITILKKEHYLSNPINSLILTSIDILYTIAYYKIISNFENHFKNSRLFHTKSSVGFKHDIKKGDMFILKNNEIVYADKDYTSLLNYRDTEKLQTQIYDMLLTNILYSFNDLNTKYTKPIVIINKINKISYILRRHESVTVNLMKDLLKDRYVYEMVPFLINLNQQNMEHYKLTKDMLICEYLLNEYVRLLYNIKDKEDITVEKLTKLNLEKHCKDFCDEKFRFYTSNELPVPAEDIDSYILKGEKDYIISKVNLKIMKPLPTKKEKKSSSSRSKTIL